TSNDTPRTMVFDPISTVRSRAISVMGRDPIRKGAFRGYAAPTRPPTGFCTFAPAIEHPQLRLDPLGHRSAAGDGDGSEPQRVAEGTAHDPVPACRGRGAGGEADRVAAVAAHPLHEQLVAD